MLIAITRAVLAQKVATSPMVAIHFVRLRDYGFLGSSATKI